MKGKLPSNELQKKSLMWELRRGEIELVKPEHCSKVQKSTLHVDLHSYSLTPPSHSPKDPKGTIKVNSMKRKRNMYFWPTVVMFGGTKRFNFSKVKLHAVIRFLSSDKVNRRLRMTAAFPTRPHRGAQLRQLSCNFMIILLQHQISALEVLGFSKTNSTSKMKQSIKT